MCREAWQGCVDLEAATWWRGHRKDVLSIEPVGGRGTAVRGWKQGPRAWQGAGVSCVSTAWLVQRARPSCSRPGAEHPSRQGPAAVCWEGSGHLVEAWFLCQWLHGRHPGQCLLGGRPGRAPGCGAAGLRPAPGPGEERRRWDPLGIYLIPELLVVSDFAARVFSPQTLNRAYLFCDDSLVRKVGQFWLHFPEMTGLPLSSHILNDFRGFTTVTQLRDLASWTREPHFPQQRPREVSYSVGLRKRWAESCWTHFCQSQR